MTLRWASATTLGWVLVSVVSSVCSVAVRADSSSTSEPALRAVELDSSRCDGVSPDELHELVALELAPRPLQATGETTDSELTRAELTCDGTRARLFVRDEARRQQQELGLDLTQIAPPARARLIALTLAELIATVDMEPVAPAPTQTIERRDEPTPAIRADSRGDWWIGAGLARQGRPRILAPSLHTGLALRVAELPLRVLGDLQLQRGQRSVAAGDVSAWTVSGSAGLGAQLLAGRSALTLGVGVRLGYARLVGDANSGGSAIAGHTLSGLWWGPTLSASAVLPLRARWGLRAGVDLTWLARGVRGLDSSGAAAYRLEGLLVQGTVGLLLALR